MTKAKYYVELRGWKSDWDRRLTWRGSYEADSLADAMRRARIDARMICRFKNGSRCSEWFPHKFKEPIHKLGVRIRHKGRTIARWQDGRRVKR